ncbi:MAG: rhodanese-like domain-containing protein [Sphingomonas sp.]
MLRLALPILLACAAVPATAQPPALDPQMDYDGYIELIREVRPYRRARLIDWNTFAIASRERNVLILDARSERQFAAGHIAGAVNLPLTEFSERQLAEVIGPDRNRPILIYCNNNFREDRPPVVNKAGRLAINLSTFAHLYGYGYRNVRELGEIVTMDDRRIRWVTGPAQSAGARAR